MKEAATIRFTDIETSDDGVIVVRYDDQKIGLAVSLRSSSDIEVILDKAAVRQMISALTEAIS